jgi:hypothetical protein
MNSKEILNRNLMKPLASLAPLSHEKIGGSNGNNKLFLNYYPKMLLHDKIVQINPPQFDRVTEQAVNTQTLPAQVYYNRLLKQKMNQKKQMENIEEMKEKKEEVQDIKEEVKDGLNPKQELEGGKSKRKYNKKHMKGGKTIDTVKKVAKKATSLGLDIAVPVGAMGIAALTTAATEGAIPPNVSRAVATVGLKAAREGIRKKTGLGIKGGTGARVDLVKLCLDLFKQYGYEFLKVSFAAIMKGIRDFLSIEKIREIIEPLVLGGRKKKGGSISGDIVDMFVKKVMSSKDTLLLKKFIAFLKKIQSLDKSDLNDFITKVFENARMDLEKKGGCGECKKSVIIYKKGGAVSGGKKRVKSSGDDKRKIRGGVIKKLMSSGLSFGEASKQATEYIKKNNLY